MDNFYTSVRPLHKIHTNKEHDYVLHRTTRNMIMCCIAHVSALYMTRNIIWK